MRDEPVQPYGELRQHAPGLWTLEGEWYDTPFRRRMTVMRLDSGGLVIHSAIRLRDEDWARLDALGPVQVVVAPNRFHGSEAHVYKARHPRARLFVSRGAERELRARCEVDGLLPAEWPPELEREVVCLELEGTRCGLHECVFLHRASRTLVLTDAAFNLQDEPRGLTRLLFRLNRIHRRFGPSRLFRRLFVGDLARARASFARLLEWEFERVVVSHGEVVEHDGREALRRGCAEMGLA